LRFSGAILYNMKLHVFLGLLALLACYIGQTNATCSVDEIRKCTKPLNIDDKLAFIDDDHFDDVCPPDPSTLNTAKECVKKLDKCSATDKEIKEEWAGQLHALEFICQQSKSDYAKYHDCIEKEAVKNARTKCEEAYKAAKGTAKQVQCQTLNARVECLYNATVQCGAKASEFWGTMQYKFESPAVVIDTGDEKCKLVDPTPSSASTNVISVLLFAFSFIGAAIFV